MKVNNSKLFYVQTEGKRAPLNSRRAHGFPAAYGPQNRQISDLLLDGAHLVLLVVLIPVLIFGCVVPAASAQAHSQTRQPVPPVTGTAKPSVSPETKAEQTDKSSELPDADDVLPGDWGPELLYGVISSPNEDARNALLDAAFAAGDALVPQLEAALKDDRTAEFAAQALAYIGGPKPFEILTKLVSDPRDLDLRRFYYGALAEFSVPQASDLLLSAINRADAEPDRTVTEAAILALTVRSETRLIPALQSAEAKIRDPVIRDDLDNAIAVIQDRARYLASSAGRNATGSLQQAVRTYFMPALKTAESGGTSSSTRSEPGRRSSALDSSAQRSPAGATRPKSPGNQAYAREADHPSTPIMRAKQAANTQPRPGQSDVKVEIQRLTFSPAKTRALARVSFEDSRAVAYYDMVLQRRGGDWVLCSIWLGPEREKPAAVGTTGLRARSQH